MATFLFCSYNKFSKGTVLYFGRLLIYLVSIVASLMNKPEALSVLHEIYDACKESFVLNCVSIDPIEYFAQKSVEGYQIKMMGDLDRNSLRCLEPILAKHKLALKKEAGFVILRPLKS